jgi:beta-galactosidase/beta-glucuronidase
MPPVPSIPRPEYPRPSFARADWLCLNGEWQFEIDPGDTGLERGRRGRDLAGRILVPFAPESALSGVGHTDFIEAAWYRRHASVPEAWRGRRVHLHFQAVDYDATVWVNGVEVGRHRGGYTPFACDLGPAEALGGRIEIVVRARDPRLPFRSWYAGGGKPCGKQSNHRYDNAGCHYTRTTGIWQTVWMEPVPEVHLLRPRVTPDVAGGAFHLVQPVTNRRPGTRLRATARDADGVVATAEAPADRDFAPQVTLAIPAARRRLWGPGEPNLYELSIELLGADGRTIDRVESYAGLRSVTIDGFAVAVNGRPVFQRLVLDQGYYPDGVLTAPDDDALRRDIELSMAAGFNGARLHQKVFEERFLYHADRLGYLVWGEFPDWGIDRETPRATYVAQWLEALHRDYSHPSLVGWCALNETIEPLGDRITGLDDLTRAMFLAAKAIDPTRPVLDASGYAHRVAETDVYDCHDYDQNPESLAKRHEGLREGRAFVNAGRAGGDGGPGEPWSAPYGGQPYFVSEFGGIWWNPDAKPGEASWGYGERPRSVDEFYRRFEGLVGVLLAHPRMFGYCYTQLTDVYQEQNGLFRFDRRAKFDLDRLRAIQRRPAAVEA